MRSWRNSCFSFMKCDGCRKPNCNNSFGEWWTWHLCCCGADPTPIHTPLLCFFFPLTLWFLHCFLWFFWLDLGQKAEQTPGADWQGKLIKCLHFFHRTLTPPYPWMKHCSLIPPSRTFTTAWMTSLEAGTVFWRDWGPRDWPWRWGPCWRIERRPLILALSYSLASVFLFCFCVPSSWCCDCKAKSLSLQVCQCLARNPVAFLHN